MSFVSVIARENFVTVMSDGRVRNSDGTIHQEDYQKFTQLTPNLFLAYSGHAPAGEFLIQALETCNFSDFARRLTFDQVYFVFNGLIEGINKSPLNGLFTFGGRNENGEIEVCYINSVDMQSGRYKPKGDAINVILMGNEVADTQKFGSFVSITGSNNSDQILAAQKLLNDYAASVDPSVNTTTFNMVMMKDNPNAETSPMDDALVQ